MRTFEEVLTQFHSFLESATYLDVVPCRWGYVRLFNEGDPINFNAILCRTPQELYTALANDLETEIQLAVDLNISDRYMRNLEKGEKVPSVDLFVELRERFGSSLDYIVLGVSASQREQELQDQLQMLRKELKEMQRRILVMLEMLGESA